MAKEIDTAKVKEIFNTMEYDNVIENTKSAKEWFGQNQSIYDHFTKNDTEPAKQEEIKDVNTGEVLGTVYTPQDSSVGKIFEEIAKNNKWAALKPIERAKLINKFASEVDKNKDLLCQIEVSARGLLSNDTKEFAVPLIVKNLQYYSSFAFKYDNSAPDAISVTVLAESSFLGLLGFILGPALATGYNVVLQTETRLSFAVFCLIQLSVKAGIPEGTIRIIPGKIDTEVIFSDKNVKVVSVYGHFDRKKYDLWNRSGKRVLAFSALKIPMIVFSNADINSACNYLVKWAWKYQGNLPWSVNKILIQEDIFDSFMTKLRQQRIKIGPSNNKLSDFTPPFDDNILATQNGIISDAKRQGIETFVLEKEYNGFTPTFLVGGIPSGETDVVVPTITAFRTINEAAALANNTKQGFGVSIWTESLSLANEVVRKLEVGNIWINCNGLLDPSVPFSLRKESGKGYYGGREGLSEYLTSTTQPKKAQKAGDTAVTADEKVINAVKTAVAAHKSWSKLNIHDRAQKLKAVADYVTASNVADAEFFESWIYNTLSDINDKISSCIYPEYDVKSYREPVGVLAIAPKSESNKNIVVASVLLGNSVIVLNDGETYSKRCMELSKYFSACGVPSGVLSAIDHSENTVNLLLSHKEVKGYCGEEYCFNAAAVMNAKNVWSTVGQSFL